ncbi:MAG TPA: hypothetical protein PK772_00890 [Chitinophagaceae bacterium]|nr:hypothetical protein [Chitinophagaceae bacterium]
MRNILNIFILLLTTSQALQAQGTYNVARYEINAKRAVTGITSADALPRSREFIRLDSTYYVGYMYEGVYKYDHAADAIGFRQAIPALEKAMQLIEKENAYVFKNLYNSSTYYAQYLNVYNDYLQIARALKECYDNIEMPDAVMRILDKIQSWNFVIDYMDSYAIKAWTIHRKRFYTHKDYAFLGNTVAENEQLALNWCYKGLQKIEINKSKIDALFGPYQSEGSKLSIYHYMAILHSYLKNYDSCEYYYQILRQGGMMSQNNYGSLQLEIGKFEQATYYYGLAKSYTMGPKSLQEPYYYLPMLSVFSGNAKEGITTAQEAIQKSGSTPGYGWYNLALARSYLYNGQLDSAAVVLNKAAQFKEIHIGTTLTQEQYTFTVQLLQLNLLNRQIAQIKFTDKRWWMHPQQISRITQLSVQKMVQTYMVATQVALNPERERIIYDLFCGESTITYDEAWTAVKDFSPLYFIDWFTKRLETDTRKDIHRYFELWIALLQLERGKETTAGILLEKILHNTTLDTEHEKLFLARLYEGLCVYYNDNGSNSDYNYYINLLYQFYPSLLTYSTLKVPIQLNVSGIDDNITQQVINDLQKGNIKITDNTQAIKTNISFGRKAQWYQVDIQTNTSSGTPVVQQTFYFKKADGVGSELLLRLFGKGGAVAWEADSAMHNTENKKEGANK